MRHLTRARWLSASVVRPGPRVALAACQPQVPPVVIVHQWVAHESVDRYEAGRFLKSLILTETPVPIAMTRSQALGVRLRGTVLLVHGFAQNQFAWHLRTRSPANYLAQQGWDVFVADLRGQGRTRDFAGSHGHVHASQYVAEDVPAAVAQAVTLTGRRVFLVGHSLGGLVCYAAAPRLQNAIAGVVSLGSPYYLGLGQPYLRRLADALLWLDRNVGLGGRRLALFALAELVVMGRVLFDSGLVPMPFRGYRRGAIEKDVLSQHMARAMDEANLQVLKSLFRAGVRQRKLATIGGLDEYARAFEQADVPLLVIAGRYDDLAPPASVWPAYQRSRAADKAYRLVPHGHLDMLIGKQAPQTTWPLLASWLQRRAGSG